MLVVISDLHFVDGTAGAHNVACEAFLAWMQDVLILAEDKGATGLDILFLGDIFDLIRTEKWFEVAPEHRPWGDPAINERPTSLRPECREHALAILEAIATEVKPHLEILTGRHSAIAPRIAAFEQRTGKPVRRLFVPGNHDRLYCVDERVRARTRELLGLYDGEVVGLSEHLYRSTEYALVARHGHEFDVWNFEGFRKDQNHFVFDENAYQKVPIGDCITTELVVKLPKRVGELLRGHVRPLVAEGVYQHLQNIENVRPVTAAIPWIWHEAGAIGDSDYVPGTGEAWQDDERNHVIEAVTEAAGEVAREFTELPFVTHWLKERDGWGWDEADELQALAGLLKLGVGMRELSSLMKTYDGFQRFAASHTDPQREAAFLEPGLETPDYHYVAYGHTHEFEQAALKVVDGHEKVYLNSGTWRSRYFLADNREDFVEWKEMTYLVFFGVEEDLAGYEGQYKGHSMLTWKGTMLKRGRNRPKP